MRSTAANFAVLAGSAVLPAIRHAMPSRPSGSRWNPFLARNESPGGARAPRVMLPVVIGHSQVVPARCQKGRLRDVPDLGRLRQGKLDPHSARPTEPPWCPAGGPASRCSGSSPGRQVGEKYLAPATALWACRRLNRCVYCLAASWQPRDEKSPSVDLLGVWPGHPRWQALVSITAMAWPP